MGRPAKAHAFPPPARKEGGRERKKKKRRGREEKIQSVPMLIWSRDGGLLAHGENISREGFFFPFPSSFTPRLVRALGEKALLGTDCYPSASWCRHEPSKRQSGYFPSARHLSRQITVLRVRLWRLERGSPCCGFAHAVSLACGFDAGRMDIAKMRTNCSPGRGCLSSSAQTPPPADRGRDIGTEPVFFSFLSLWRGGGFFFDILLSPGKSTPARVLKIDGPFRLAGCVQVFFFFLLAGIARAGHLFFLGSFGGLLELLQQSFFLPSH